MLKDEIEKESIKKMIKKQLRSIWVNMLKPLSGSWDQDIFIKKNKNYRASFLTHSMSNVEIEKTNLIYEIRITPYKAN